jgi:hypothetical protein
VVLHKNMYVMRLGAVAVLDLAYIDSRCKGNHGERSQEIPGAPYTRGNNMLRWATQIPFKGRPHTMNGR